MLTYKSTAGQSGGNVGAGAMAPRQPSQQRQTKGMRDKSMSLRQARSPSRETTWDRVRNGPGSTPVVSQPRGRQAALPASNNSPPPLTFSGQVVQNPGAPAVQTTAGYGGAQPKQGPATTGPQTSQPQPTTTPQFFYNTKRYSSRRQGGVGGIGVEEVDMEVDLEVDLGVEQEG